MKHAVLILSVLFIAGCATQLTPQQRRALQSRTFHNTSMDNVFRAFKTVLQDEGYVIKNQDTVGGLIVAEIQKTDKKAASMASRDSTKNFKTGQTFELSVNLESTNGTTVETRLVVQEKSQMSMGYSQAEEVLDAALFQNLYQKVATEVERRKAQGKN